MFIVSLLRSESSLDSPFAPKLKCEGVAKAVLTPLSMVGGSVIGTYNNERNIDMQRETNQQNLEMQREINQQNKDLFHEAQQWSEQMWNKQNEYNDPSAQVARLAKAGLNPAMQFGQGNIASSLSAPSAPEMRSSPSVAPQSDARLFGDSVFNAINAFNQSRLTTAEVANTNEHTRQLEFDNEFNSKTLVERVNQLRYKARQDKANASLYENEAKLAIQTFNAKKAIAYGDVKMQGKQFELLDQQITGQVLDNAAKEIENKWLPVLNKDKHNEFLATINQAKAQVGLILANKTLTYAQAETEVARKVGLIIDNGMKGIDFDIKKQVKADIVDTYRNQADYEGFKAGNEYRKLKYGEGSRLPQFESFGGNYPGYNDASVLGRYGTRLGRRTINR